MTQDVGALVTQTSGSLSKLTGCLEQHYKRLGLDPLNGNNNWTIVSTPPEHGNVMNVRNRILVAIEFPPQSRNPA